MTDNDAVGELFLLFDEGLDVGREVFVATLSGMWRLAVIPQVLRWRTRSRSGSKRKGKRDDGKPNGGESRTTVMMSRSIRFAIPLARLLQFCLLPNKPCSTTTGARDEPEGAACFSDESVTDGVGVAAAYARRAAAGAPAPGRRTRAAERSIA